MPDTLHVMEEVRVMTDSTHDRDEYIKRLLDAAGFCHLLMQQTVLASSTAAAYWLQSHAQQTLDPHVRAFHHSLAESMKSWNKILSSSSENCPTLIVLTLAQPSFVRQQRCQ